MKTKSFFLCAAFLSAVIFGPVVVSADHTFDHTLQQLRDRFHFTFESLLTGRGGAAPDADLAFLLAAADENRVKSLENEVQSYQSRIQELKSKSQTASEAREIKLLEDEVEYVQSKLDELRSGGLRLTRTLQRGSSGEDVKQLQEFLAKDKEVYPEGLATGYFGSLTEKAVQNFQEKNGIEPVGIVGPKTRAALAAGAEGLAPKISAPEPKGLLARTLTQGASGDDVKDTQELLKRFPDIYPQGSATGFYGPATENAVKKLQEKLGLSATGSINGETQKKINGLASAVERKQPPKISGIAPAGISVNTKVTITGSGFTLENNSLFVKGKTILTGLTSHDGTAIVFLVPSDIPCDVGQACPIKIVNANGISNARPFKLVEAVPTPSPEPEPTPAPTPAPTPSPCVPVTLNVPEKYPTIQSAIDAATCPGTIIQIAAGTYYEILVMKSDLTLVGAGPWMTIIDGSKTPATINPWGYLVQNFNVITAGKPGAGLKNIQIKNLSITGSGAYGDNAAIRIQDSSNVLVENVLFYRNTDGLRIYGSSPVTVKNVTLVGNRNGVMSHGTTNVTVKNSIITQNSAWGLYATIGVQLTSVYNAVWGNGTNYDGTALGVGDISLDPRLGSAPQYLVSSGSPTIDAGDPADVYSYEPLPNCGRINMGSYGNTQWATTCYVPAPVAPQIISISPSFGKTGTKVILIGTGFTTSDNTINFEAEETLYDVLSAPPTATLTNVSSSDGTTLIFNLPDLYRIAPIQPYKIWVVNKNGVSNSVRFDIAQTVTPVLVIAPNGGETFIMNGSASLRWSGGVSDTYTAVDIALVPEIATSDQDIRDQIIGWMYVGWPASWLSATWGAPQNPSLGGNVGRVCGRDPLSGKLATTTCFFVEPGRYKLLVVGENELGNRNPWPESVYYDGSPGFATKNNYDVSDAPFTILAAPTPTLTVVSPNGGEAYKNGDAVTITWKADNITSRSVNIKLFKAGGLVQTIASNVPQGTATGLFLYNWVIPNYLVPASDYTIEISDAANSAVKDTSDGNFRIANLAVLQIYGPNGGETAMRGFNILLFWTYSGYSPASINVNLYKAGAFYRTLATGVVPVGFSGYSFLKNPYPYNSRYAEIPLALDISEGDDYTLEIIDGADSSIRDKSDAAFKIISLPSPVTFKGRMVDALSGAPMPNISFFDWTRISTTTFITGSNGEFSFSADISSMTDPAIRNKFLSGGVPQCNDATTLSLFRYPDFLRTTFGGWYGGLYPLSSVRRQYLPVTSSIMNLGDIPMWPSTDFIHTFTDIPSSFGVYYPAGGGGMGNSNYTIQHGLQNTPPLGVDIYVQYKDKAGTIYNSPTSRFSTDTRCQIATHSFMNGTYQWEPYPIGVTVDWTGGGTTWSVGRAFKITFKTYGGGYYGNSVGVAPLTWEMAFGSLPPGLSLNSTTGEIIGIPTIVGTYVFGVKVKDANGVRASSDLSIIVQ